MIPSTLHQIWIGSPIDSMVIPWMHQAESKAEEYILWTDDTIWDELGTTREDFEKYWNVHNEVDICDVLRLLIIQKHGGWYADCDIKLMKDVDVYRDNNFVITERSERVRNDTPKDVVAYFFGATQGCSLLSVIISEMEKIKDSGNRWLDERNHILFGETLCTHYSEVTYIPFSETGKLLKHYYLSRGRR